MRRAVRGGDMHARAALAALGEVEHGVIGIGAAERHLGAIRLKAVAMRVANPHSRQLSPRVRVFVDWLAKAFA